jgi:protein-disulfide isomerase
MNKSINTFITASVLLTFVISCSKQTEPAKQPSSQPAETKASTGKGKIEAEILKSVALEESPRDVAVSLDGAKAYVLTSNYIYVFNTVNFELVDRIPVKGTYSNISISPDGGSLYLTDSTAKLLSIMQITERVSVEIGQSPIIGNKNAPVHIIAFLDYQCPYCASMYPILQQLLDKYPDKVNLIIKHFPLRMHPFAEKAALACLAASKQNKYRELSDVYFRNSRNLNDDTIVSLAQQAGLNSDAFNKERSDQNLKNIINEDLNLGRKLNIRGVPAVFINGRAIKNRSIDGLSQMVEQELNKK